MTERWKRVAGFGDAYEISDSGSIRSFKRSLDNVMNTTITPSGHRFVGLSLNGIRYTKYIHRLVLEAFVGPCPEGMECRHLDGDPSNNRVDNLKWGTSTENAADMVRHGTVSVGEKNGRSKLCELDVWLIRNVDLTTSKIAEFLGISQKTASDARRRITWKHVA